MPRSAEVIRQWNVLRELEASRRATISGLAQKMDVTTRTIRRDLEALQVAGFPIFDELVDGKRFWKLDTKPFRKLGGEGETSLSLPELYALYFSRVLLEGLAGTLFKINLTSAFNKFEAVLTPGIRTFFEKLPNVLQVKAGRAKKGLGGKLDKTIARLIDATLLRRQATMHYHSLSSRRMKDYLVEPYRLLHFQGGLYLFAYVPEYKEMRTFAVERIKRLSLLQTTFKPSQKLSLELFAHSLGLNQGPPQRVELEFAPKSAPYVREVKWHASQRAEDQPDGSLRLSLNVCVDQPLRNWILSFGANAHVVAPKGLATEIAAEFVRARARYDSGPGKH